MLDLLRVVMTLRSIAPLFADAPEDDTKQNAESSFDDGRIRAERRVGEPISARRESVELAKAVALGAGLPILLWTRFSFTGEAIDNAFKSH